jgi:ATPase subunit of ABC transporter with duplicated ATPase domains
VIIASGIAMPFGTKPRFSDLSVKLGGGYRYGLIGANCSRKSTTMNSLRGELELATAYPGVPANRRNSRLVFGPQVLKCGSGRSW